MEEIKRALGGAAKDLFNVAIEPELTRPDEQFGDYSSNIAMQLAGKLNKNPREIAEAIKAKLSSPLIVKTEVARPGFLNITLTDDALVEILHHQVPKPNQGKEILVEFGDPNPFKEMHLGHLYAAIVGDSIAHLLEASGANVKRLSYHGDVGMQVAKWLWGRQHAEIGKDNEPLGYYYALGAQAFEDNEEASEEIRDLNEKVYKADPAIKDLYEAGKIKSFEQFDAVFKELGITYDKRYLESESSKVGLEFVKQHTGKVFEESEGAVVYKGEKAGLHTRVFINSRGLPTYEAKDLGLTELKAKDFPGADRSIIITANEQNEYFKVMLAALKEIDPQLSGKTTHLSHGFLSLTTGKMSSRTGNVVAANDLLESVREAANAQYPESKVQEEAFLAAVKYTFLKHRIGGDIVFDVKESVSLEGNSGPYLQYAHARARSILSKKDVPDEKPDKFEVDERSLLRKITEYPEAVEKAVNELMPHHIATYLYELAQVFNRFYEKNRVIDDPRETVRLQLVQSYADTLKNGLDLLNIPAPDKM